MHEHNHEEEGGEEGCQCHCHQMPEGMKREFKLAMLEKKEKIMQAKLEFIGKMKAMIQKAGDSK